MIRKPSQELLVESGNWHVYSEPKSSGSGAYSYQTDPIASGRAGTTSTPAFLGQKFNEKRKMSIAPWSDDKLMQFAANLINNQQQKESRLGTQKSQDSLHRSTDSLQSLQLNEKQTGIFVLGPSLLAKVFKLFDLHLKFKLRRVNRAFKNIIMSDEHEILENVDLTPWNKSITNDRFEDILSVTKHRTKFLIMKNCWHLNDVGLSHITAYTQDVVRLDLHSVWDMTDNGLYSIARHCDNLEFLDLSNCRKITSKGMLEVLKYSQSLTNLSVSYCKNLGDEMMGHTQWCCIVRLDFQRCTGISDVGFGKWLNTEVPAGMGYSRSQTSSVPFNTQLSELSCGSADAHEETDSVRSNLGASSFPPSIEVTSLLDSDSNTSHQKQLSDSHEMLEQSSPRISFVATDFDTRISVSLNGTDSYSYFALEELNLNDCSYLTDKTVKVLGQKCPKLTNLHLSFCCSLTEDFASYLVDGCPFITMLDCSYCGNAITDSSLFVISQGLLKLTSLSIRGCVQVTSEGVTHLSQFAKSLQHVNFTQCRGITNEVIENPEYKWTHVSQAYFDIDINALG
jgi:Leucine Rich repeat